MSALSGSQIQPVTPSPIIGQGQQQNFFNALFGMGMPGGQIQGQSGYPGAVSPDMSQMMLPGVWQNWNPWNTGTQFLANYLGPGMDASRQQFQGPWGDVSQYGGTGAPLGLMQNIAQGGGTGGPGSAAMQTAMQWGTPSPDLKGMSQIANTGIGGQYGIPLQYQAQTGQSSPELNIGQIGRVGSAGSWGQPLNAQIASGAPSSALGALAIANAGIAGPYGAPLASWATSGAGPGSQYLMPFLNARPYRGI